ncbi:MAG: TIGR03000 domain-containing protein, partial [Planctomycetales bacterium]
DTPCCGRGYRPDAKQAAPARHGADHAGYRDTGKKADESVLNVSVPQRAKVFVNGDLTHSVGRFRQFGARGLKPGETHTYRIRAEVQRHGQTLVQTQNVRLAAGDRRTVRFDFLDAKAAAPTLAPAKSPTTVILKVPENAQVFLGGSRTLAQGKLRRYENTQLLAGTQWNNYTIRVAWPAAGGMETQERTVSLTGGQTHQFDFTRPEIAQQP